MSRVHFFILLTWFSVNLSQSQEMKLMTYNIKYDNKKDTVNNWNDRKTDMVELIKHYGAGFVGMQEVLFDQLNYLDDALDNFEYVGVGRDDGERQGEFSPILYNTDKYKVLESSTFWLSDTPEKVSVGWDAAMERICTYGLFEEKGTKLKFLVFNTHFDHIGKTARKKSAALIVSKIQEINSENIPVVLMGDLNLTPDSAPIKYLQNEMVDGQGASITPFYGPTGTFNGFNQNQILDRRIDYIFVKGFEVSGYVHIDDRMENNKHISDHLPVLITVAFD